MSNVQEIPLDLPKLTKIWWSFTWRYALLGVAVGFGLLIIVGIMTMLLGWNPETVDSSVWLQILFAALGMLGNFYVIYWVLSLKYSNFRIALVSHAESSEEPNNSLNPDASDAGAG